MNPLTDFAYPVVGALGMTGEDIRQRLCGSARSFTLATAEIKARIGHPDEIHILPRWCRRTGRDVLVLSNSTDQGAARVLGTVGFLNGEESIFDGWVVVIDRSKDVVQIHGQAASIAVEQNLFEQWCVVPVEDDGSQHSQSIHDTGHSEHCGGSNPADNQRTLFDGLPM